MNLRVPALALCLLSAPAASLADDAEEVGQEPTRRSALAPEHGKAAVADASPVDPGAVEVEIGYAPVWNTRGRTFGFDDAASAHTHGFGAALTYGVLPDLDVRVGAGFAQIHDAAYQREDGSAPHRGLGLTDGSVGARWRFLNLPEQALELAVTGDVVVPIGLSGTSDHVGLSQEFWSARGALVATKDFGAITTNAELAFAAPVSGGAGGLQSITQASAAVGYQLTPSLQPELELSYGYSAMAGAPDSQVLAVTAGVVSPFGAGHRVITGIQYAVWGRNTIQTTAGVVSFKTGF